MELLALVEQAGHVCCRYRIAAFEPYLKAQGVNITYESIESSPVKRFAQMRRAGAYDSVIIQRKLLDSLSLSILRKSARYLVYDFDDAVLYRDSYDPRGRYCPKRTARFARTVSVADMVLAGNSFLAQRAEEYGASPMRVHYMPTCVDLKSYEAARARLNGQRQGDGEIVLVWIGSSSTLKGLEATRSLWECIGELLPEVMLRVVCDRFPEFEKIRVERVEWSQEVEIESIVTADVGISHVPDDAWSRGKCGLKVLQYMAGGLPVLTNPVGVHGEMVKPGVNGFLVNQSAEWYEAVRWLAENRSVIAEMGQASLERVRYGYDVADWGLFFVDRVMPGAVSATKSGAWEESSSGSGSQKWLSDQPSGQDSIIRGIHHDSEAKLGMRRS